MSLTKKLKFTEEQKKEYKKLRIICGTVGIVGIILAVVFYIFGYTDYADLTISITLSFLVIYVYWKYVKVLSKTKVTRAYSDFQKRMYALALLFAIPYLILLGYLVSSYMDYFANNIILLIALMIIPGIVAGLIVAYYEKKKFGALQRAP